MMLNRLIPVKKDLRFERTYAAPRARVWEAWTQPALLTQWWGPENTSVPECEVDLRIGGAIRIVMVAGAGMGKYAGTRWPMAGVITVVNERARLSYDARSWTEGQEEETTIHHANDLMLADGPGGGTVMSLRVTITQIGPEAKLAAFGMKWGYKQQFQKLGALLDLSTP
jgi:uncharacterized protein YndB with AHSA1/START domain